MTKHVLAAMWLLWALGATGSNRLPFSPVAGVTLLAQQPAPIEEFVPIDELPPQDQLPAAPLLVGAYSFAALALFAYVGSVARRLGGVQRDLERLQAHLKRSGRA
jgi:hypothetical protein